MGLIWSNPYINCIQTYMCGTLENDNYIFNIKKNDLSSMSLLFEIYNAFPTFGQASKQVHPYIHLVSELGQVFVDYSMHEHYGLCVIHKHFEISDDELVVEASNSDTSVSLPWKGLNPPMDILSKFDVQPFSDGRIFPRAWIVRDSCVIPYEFVWSNECELPKFPSGFITDIFSKLENHNLNEILGVYRLSGRDLKESVKEFTDTELRANICVLGEKSKVKVEKYKKDGEHFPSQWSFKKIKTGFVEVVVSRCEK